MAMLRVTVAFATASHAAEGLAFIDRARLGVRQASPSRGGVGGECVQIELEVSRDNAARLETLLCGVHAVVVAGSSAHA
jgi:hypothetical protein